MIITNADEVAGAAFVAESPSTQARITELFAAHREAAVLAERARIDRALHQWSPSTAKRVLAILRDEP